MTYTILWYNQATASLCPPLHIKIFSKLFNNDNMNIPNIDENILKPIKKENPPTPKAKTLDDLDLDKELLQQFTTAKEVLEDIRHEQDVPANQKAQVINTITNILQSILKMQQDLHNVERMKLVENTLIEVLQRHQTLREAFLEDYEKALKKLETE